MVRRVVRCVLSGSYHRDRLGLKSAYNELITCGCQVLSPHRLDFDAEDTLFVRDSAEIGISEKELEHHHLLGIRQADFLWVHAPDGHVGTSTAFELGYAFACGIPVFSEQSPADVMLQDFVHKVPSVFKAMEYLENTTSQTAKSYKGNVPSPA